MRGLSRFPAASLAFLASFGVYLLPIVGAHTSWAWGQALVKGISSGTARREPLWMASEWALALLTQAVAGLLWYWIFRRPLVKKLGALLLGIVAFGLVVPDLYMRGIPKYFLGKRVQPDTAPERTGPQPDMAPELGALECAVPNVDLPRSGTFEYPWQVDMARAGRALVVQYSPSHPREEMTYALLQMPGCQLSRVAVPYEQGMNQPYILPSGAGLYRTSDPKMGHGAWWLSRGPETPPMAVETPSDARQDAGPILSEDGEWVVWVLLKAGAHAGAALPPTKFLVQQIGGPKQYNFTLPAIEVNELWRLDMRSREIVLSGSEDPLGALRRFYGVGLDGAVHWGPANSPPKYWRTAVSASSAAISWSLPAGSGTHTIPAGRTLNSYSTDPEGKFIAASVVGPGELANVRDAVFVLRAADGAEVFRKYLPAHSDSQVAFLGSAFFAYYEGGGVQVYRLPKEAPQAVR